MRVLVSAYGSRGCATPLAALAVHLRTVGAEVRACAPSDAAFTGLPVRVGMSLERFSRLWRASERPPIVEELIAHVTWFLLRQGSFASGHQRLSDAAQRRARAVPEPH